MAYWVHLEQPGSVWRTSESYEPPAPNAEGCNGYPVLCVESQDFVFRFSSAAQLAECVEILARKPLPTSRRLSAVRAGGHGPNSHWISRLPGRIKSPKIRQRAVEDLRSVISVMAPNSSFKPKPPRDSA